MTFRTLATAGLMSLAAIVPAAIATPALAQMHERTVVHQRTVVRHGDPIARTRQVCTVERRGHRKVRHCRMVRR